MSDHFSSTIMNVSSSFAAGAAANDNHNLIGNINHDNNLERKLELLEARFTMPPPGKTNTTATTTSTVPSAAAADHYSSNSHHYHTANNNNPYQTFSNTSSPENRNNSNYAQQAAGATSTATTNALLLASAPNSEHSFGFDAPTFGSFSRLSSSSVNNHHHHSSNNNHIINNKSSPTSNLTISSHQSMPMTTSSPPVSNLPASAIRQKKRRNSLSSLEAVSLAAERHMRKVAAANTRSSSPKNFAIHSYYHPNQRHPSPYHPDRSSPTSASASGSASSNASLNSRSRSPTTAGNAFLSNNNTHTNYSFTNLSNSNQTMRTSHVQSSGHQQQQHLVPSPPSASTTSVSALNVPLAQLPTKVTIQESPPQEQQPRVSGQLPPTPTHNRQQNPETPSSLVSSSLTTKDKRKSVPVKREFHSVTQAIPLQPQPEPQPQPQPQDTTATTTSTTMINNNPSKKKTPTRAGLQTTLMSRKSPKVEPRKRTRLQFNNFTENTHSHPKKTTSSRSPIQSKTLPVDTNTNSRSSNPPPLQNTNVNNTAKSTVTTTNNHNNTKVFKAPNNNMLIYDFFTSAIKKNTNDTKTPTNTTANSGTATTVATSAEVGSTASHQDNDNDENPKDADTSVAAVATSSVQNPHSYNQQVQPHNHHQLLSPQGQGFQEGSSAIEQSNANDYFRHFHPNNNNAQQRKHEQHPHEKKENDHELRTKKLIEEFRIRCEELENLCKDKDDQLRAISNNRTIMHTAIQSALKQKENELEQVKLSKSKLLVSSTKTIEELVRIKISNEHKELREKLASDSSRLGKIVYSRSGISGMMSSRSSTVETWEEGHASKALYQKRCTLFEILKVLENRQKVAKQCTKQFLLESNKENATGINNNTSYSIGNDMNNNHAMSKNHTSNTTESTSNSNSELVVEGIRLKTEFDAMEAIESVRLHLSNVRRQIKELEIEEQKLNNEKVAHIRALKTVANEDSSRFRKRPKLHDRYILSFLLGKGGFSEVWRAYDLLEHREVAVKIHQLDPRWPDEKKENYTKHVSREYEIHRNVRHPRIVSLFDVFEIDTDSFATVLECCNGTDLDSLLKKQKRLPERDARAILLQILSGMQYLSHPSADGRRQGIIHYDLKPGNILFDEYGDAKITDFGLSKIVDTQDATSMELTSQGAGTYWYLPPECFIMPNPDEESHMHQPVRISNKVDVWSIGVIYYQMLYGKRPFGEGQSQDKLLSDRTMLNARDVRFPDKPKVSMLGKDFIRNCLTYDQTFRPSIGQICKDPYLVGNQFLSDASLTEDEQRKR